MHFFRCDAFVFLCYLLEGFLSFLVQSSSLKKQKQKKRIKKREEFFWDHFLLKKTKQQHNTRCFPIQSRRAYHPHLIIVQKEGQTTNFNSLEKRRREGDGVRVSA